MPLSVTDASVPGLALLHAFLTSGRTPPGAMRLSDLDGFLTAIALTPDPPAAAEWLPPVWGGGEPAFESAAEKDAVQGAVLARLAAITAALAPGPAQVQPILLYTPDDQPVGTDWAAGFLAGMTLRPDSWLPLLRSRQSPFLGPVIVLGLPPDQVPPEYQEMANRDGAQAEAVRLLPTSIAAIADFWRRHAARPTPGRNDPCPCGSGKKYKRCCGQG